MRSRRTLALVVVLAMAVGAILAVTAPIALAEPDVTLIEYPANPVYDPVDTTERAYYPNVLYDVDKFSGHGDSYYYKMWYSDAKGQYEAVVFSDDGINWGNPVQTTGIKPAGYHAEVLYIPEGYSAPAGTYYYKIWYWDSSVPGVPYSINGIRTADSIDGVNWANDAVIVQDDDAKLVTGVWPDWNRGTYGPVSVHYNPDATNAGANPFDYSFAMYYDGTTGGVESIGLGYSPNGNTNWRIYGSAPVLDYGEPGDWDSDYVTAGTVIKGTDGTWRMWFSGSGPSGGGNEGIGYATSTDGLTWTKDADNPVFSIYDGVEWRDDRTYTPSVLYSPTRFDGNGDYCSYKMWFTGSDGSNLAIGYTSTEIEPIPITVTADPQTKVFGQADPELTYTCDTPGVTFTGALSRVPGEDAGTYPITLGTLDAGPDYIITLVSADLTIEKAGTAVGVCSSWNPAWMFLGLFGKKVTFTAKVTATPPGAGTPDGTVTFYDGTRKLGTSWLDGTGKASFSINPICLCWGRHCITATYSGSANFNGSTSPALTQWVL